MTQLLNHVTGHQITTDDKSVEFWKGAGYVPVEQKKAPAKKAAPASSKSSNK